MLFQILFLSESYFPQYALSSVSAVKERGFLFFFSFFLIPLSNWFLAEPKNICNHLAVWLDIIGCAFYRCACIMVWPKYHSHAPSFNMGHKKMHDQR